VRLAGCVAALRHTVAVNHQPPGLVDDSTGRSLFRESSLRDELAEGLLASPVTMPAEARPAASAHGQPYGR
jgi:hypothetical protein